MGKLLKFDERKRSATAGNIVSGDAQIFIFTGVRYERGTPPPPPKTELDTKRRRRRRG